MKQTVLFLTFIAFFNVNGQEYDVISTAPQINNITLRETTEEEISSLLGEPDKVEEEINAIGEEENLRQYYYEDSYFRCWDGFVQSFLIKDSGFRYNDLFEVGDGVDVLETHFPNSFSNPVKEENINNYDKTNFDFDTAYWVNGGGGNGLIILVKEEIIIGFRYSVGV